jgi:hypothetical protein
MLAYALFLVLCPAECSEAVIKVLYRKELSYLVIIKIISFQFSFCGLYVCLSVAKGIKLEEKITATYSFFIAQ